MNNKRKYKNRDYEALRHEKETKREELRRLRKELHILEMSRLSVLHNESDNDGDSLFRKAYNDFMKERGDIC